jgi:hypothetical protein
MAASEHDSGFKWSLARRWFIALTWLLAVGAGLVVLRSLWYLRDPVGRYNWWPVTGFEMAYAGVLALAAFATSRFRVLGALLALLFAVVSVPLALGFLLGAGLSEEPLAEPYTFLLFLLATALVSFITLVLCFVHVRKRALEQYRVGQRNE